MTPLFNQTITRKRGELLPHWTMNKAIYNVCFRLADSLPASVRRSYTIERDSILQRASMQSRELTEDEIKEISHLHTTIIDKSLDGGYGKCHLKRYDIAETVISTITHFDNERYKLHTWCIMPNHVHLIIEPSTGHELFNIIHSWKSYSASMINKKLNLKGSFWHKDAFNHIIRSEKAYAFQMDYIWNNPEKAGLHDWKLRYRREAR